LRFSAVLIVPAALAAACGDDDTCGARQPAGATAGMVSVDGMTFEYGTFTAGENNDCPPPGSMPGPDDPVSVTIIGMQTGQGFPLTLCLRRPERIGAGPIDLADTDLIQFEDASARAPSGCTYARFPQAVPTGTVTFDGFCVEGGAVYNMTLAGQIAGVRTCPADGGSVQEMVTLTLSGTVQVTAVAPRLR
jgi:hypothetical protein